MQVFNPQGHSVVGERGELVCTNSLPNFPSGFWRDSGERYHRAYWDKFDNVWHHGDDVEKVRLAVLSFMAVVTPLLIQVASELVPQKFTNR